MSYDFYTIPHIQEELDATFPGCRLEYVALWGYWVITDYLVAPDGSPATGIYFRVPWSLLPSTDGELTNRKVVFILSHPDTGLPVEPSAENVLGTMYAAYTGGNNQAIQKWEDRVDESQRLQEEEHEKASRDAIREAAKNAYDRTHGRLVSTSAGIHSYDRTSEFIEAQIAAQCRRDAAMAGGAEFQRALQRGVSIRGHSDS